MHFWWSNNSVDLCWETWKALYTTLFSSLGKKQKVNPTTLVTTAHRQKANDDHNPFSVVTSVVGCTFCLSSNFPSELKSRLWERYSLSFNFQYQCDSFFCTLSNVLCPLEVCWQWTSIIFMAVQQPCSYRHIPYKFGNLTVVFASLRTLQCR